MSPELLILHALAWWTFGFMCGLTFGEIILPRLVQYRVRRLRDRGRR